MTVSVLRTIKIGGRPSGYRISFGGPYGVMPSGPVYRWPTKEPDEDLDYSIDITDLLADVDDTISSVGISMAPSNAASARAISLSYSITYLGVPNAWDDACPELTEAQPLSVSASDGVITAWIAGGVPGRKCRTKIDVRTAAGRTFEFVIGLEISRDLATWLQPLPANPGFGDPLYWESHTLNFGIPADSQYIALL